MNKLSLPFALSIVFLVAIRAEAQQLRDVVRQVDASVVVVKTVEKNLLPDGSAASAIMDYLNKLKPGEEVTVSVLRGGQITKLKTIVPTTF